MTLFNNESWVFWIVCWILLIFLVIFLWDERNGILKQQLKFQTHLQFTISRENPQKNQNRFSKREDEEDIYYHQANHPDSGNPCTIVELSFEKKEGTASKTKNNK